MYIKRGNNEMKRRSYDILQFLKVMSMIAFLSVPQCWAQGQQQATDQLQQAYQQEEYARVIELADQMIRSDENQSSRGFYWITKARIAQEEYHEAANAIQSFSKHEAVSALQDSMKKFTEIILHQTGKASLSEVMADDEQHEELGQVYVMVEEMPSIKGGMASIQKKIEYPKQARKAGIEGRVLIQAVITKDGEARKIKVLRGIGGGCDEEARRVIRQSEFIPGKQRGKPVNVQMTIPVIFKLSN
jgi:TonB family protein